MKRLQKKRYVYFLRSKCAEGRIKIGCSYKPVDRLVYIGVWSPYELELIGWVDGDFELERSLHSYFASDRMHCEWFHSSPELVFVIDQMLNGKDLAAAIWEYDRSLARAA